MIDTTKTVSFYDDRGKEKEFLLMTMVLFQNARVCLCTTGDDEVGEVLFARDDGRVLSNNLEFWYATN